MTPQDHQHGFGMIEWIILLALLGIGVIIAITSVGNPTKQKLLSTEEELQPVVEDVTREKSASSPLTQTGLTKSPSFDTKYLQYQTDNITQFSIIVTPIDLAGKTISGYEVPLATRGYTLPTVTSSSVNLNEEGWYKSDWQCNTIGDVYRCLGKDTLREGKHSTVGLNFSRTVEMPPSFLHIKLLDSNGTTVVGVGVELKTGE